MALQRETTFKKTRSQYLADHPALHGQPCAMRPASLGRRHGKGCGGKQHKLRQKCWKASYRISAMLISKSMSEAEPELTSYKHMICMFFPELWFFTVLFNPSIVSVSVRNDLPRSFHSWKQIYHDLYLFNTTLNLDTFNHFGVQKGKNIRSWVAKKRNIAKRLNIS